MEKEFISYDHALRMKALGFDYNILGFYYDNKLLEHCCGNTEVKDLEKGDVPAPTFSQAFRWFRENYKMNQMIQITTSNGTRENWFWEIYDSRGWKVKDGQELSDPYNISYEEAELACLEKLIEIVESKSK